MKQSFFRFFTVIVILAIAVGALPGGATPAQALSTGLVISQVYGGGGNSGATYKNDYIEIFNRGASAIDLTGMSVQYASSTGTTWSATPLSGTLAAGRYYLVQEAAGSGGTTDLPDPDATGSLNLSGTKGKVALVSSTTALSGACPTTGVIDFVGFGSANCYETAAVAALSNTTAAKRNANGCTETDNNGTDFTVADPTADPIPRNSSSSAHLCNATPALSIDDVSVTEGNSGTVTASFTVGLSVAAASPVSFDIATADDTATTANNDYAAQALTGQTIAAGDTSYTFDVTVNGDPDIETDENFYVNITNVSGATLTDGQGIGTITNDDVPAYGLSINDVTVTEGNTGTTTASFTVSLSNPAPTGGLTFNIATSDGTATVADNDYVAKNVTGAVIAEGNTTYAFDVSVNGDTAVESNETFNVVISSASGGAVITKDTGVGTITNDDVAITPICAIQGSGTATSMSGVQTIQGVVIGDFEGGVSPQIRGFYVQQANCDSDPATSDGIFVYNGSNNSVSLGDQVQVTGTVGEYQSQTQLSNVTNITVMSSGNTLAPTDITLPFASESQKEQYEGMLVRVNQTLYVTEHYQLGRFGQVTLSSGERLYQPTHLALPGSAERDAIVAANALNQIILDDANQVQNPDPILFGRNGDPLSASNTLRGGDTITGLTGVFTYTWSGNSASGNAYRIRPVTPTAAAPAFSAANPRPTANPVVDSDVKVASFNLLNYFNTFDGNPDVADNCTGGVGGAAMDCRGADDATEFERQYTKTVLAIIGTDADVVGVMEMENDGYGSESAIQHLVNELNAASSPGTYAFIDADALTRQTNALGTDAIKVGLLYKPGTVTPVGTTAVLNTVDFVNGGDSVERNRPSLLQAFEHNASGEIFLVDVNHFKSKGSACEVPDAGDGQGNCNIVRTNAANTLTSWLATNPTGTGDPDVLILGDLNSYAKEDPIAALEAGGLTNFNSHFGGTTAYSYVYSGQWGYLDYALGSASMLAQTDEVVEWHINADEPSVLDYNVNFKTAGQITNLYAEDAYRTSDHDPIIVGLTLDDSISPVVASITRADPNPTNAASVDFTVTFSGTVSGVDTSDFTPTLVSIGSLNTAAVTNVIPVSSSVYIVTVSTGLTNAQNLRDGALRLDIPATATITNLSAASLPYTNGEVYSIVSEQTFPDVASTYWAWTSIERVYYMGITNGFPDGTYRPEDPATRGQMAVFLLKAKHGFSYTPPTAAATFTDTSGHWAEAWIEALRAEGIANGYTDNSYRPDNSVTRGEIAVFLLKAKHGSSYTPPTSAATFSDTAAHWAETWIEALKTEGITSGYPDGTYKPDSTVTRAEMAVFLVRAFNLP